MSFLYSFKWFLLFMDSPLYGCNFQTQAQEGISKWSLNS